MAKTSRVQEVTGGRPPQQLLQVSLALQRVVQSLAHAQALQPIEFEQRLDLVLGTVPVVPAHLNMSVSTESQGVNHCC